MLSRKRPKINKIKEEEKMEGFMALSKALSLLHFQKKTMKKTYKIYGATNAF